MRHNGFATLTSVLVICSILLAVGLVLHAQLRSHFDDTMIDAQRIQARELAQSCLQEGAYQYARSNTYAGSNVALPDGTCTIHVTKQKNSIMITAEAHTRDITKRFQLTYTSTAGTISPSHFQELP